MKDIFEKPQQKSNEKSKVEWNPAEGNERIAIEWEFIDRLGIRDYQEKEKWIQDNAGKFAQIIDERKDSFLELHKKDPRALYEIIEQLLQREN